MPERKPGTTAEEAFASRAQAESTAAVEAPPPHLISQKTGGDLDSSKRMDFPCTGKRPMQEDLSVAT